MIAVEWLPIESAPRDRLFLLAVKCGSERRAFAARYATKSVGLDRIPYWSITVGWIGWTELSGEWIPTNWMPLPPPPEEKK